MGWFLAAELHLTLQPQVLHLTLPSQVLHLTLPPHPILFFAKPHYMLYVSIKVTASGKKKPLHATVTSHDRNKSRGPVDVDHAEGVTDQEVRIEHAYGYRDAPQNLHCF